MLAIAEELLRTAMVSNYIDMKQEMADRITPTESLMPGSTCASVFKSEEEKLKTHMSSKYLEAKCQGAKIALW